MKPVVYFALTAALLMPCARADEWNKKMIVTVKEPVQVPGKTLDPGAYVFRLRDSLSNRNIVQIYNRREDHLYQTVQAIPNHRLTPAPGVTILLEERAVGEPEAIKAIFFPGDNFGQEFLYPAAPVRTAIAVTEHPLVAAAKPAPPPPAAPPAAAQPTPTPEVTPTPSPTPTPTPEPETPPAETPLPHAASNQALIALAGLLSLAIAFGLRASQRTSKGRG